MPKDDGTLRPLGISGTEDKFVQELTRRILEAIYEPTFRDTSYGFCPGRSYHDALRQRPQSCPRAVPQGRTPAGVQVVESPEPTAQFYLGECGALRSAASAPTP
jgi:hypothetical protein